MSEKSTVDEQVGILAFIEMCRRRCYTTLSFIMDKSPIQLNLFNDKTQVKVILQGKVVPIS